VIVLGKNVNLYIYSNGAYQVISCSKSCTLETTTEIAERTTSQSGYWKQYKALANSARLTVEGDTFFDKAYTVIDLQQMQFSFVPVNWSFEWDDKDGHIVTYSGQAVIETITHTGEVSNPATFTANMVVDGAISTSTTPVPITTGGTTVQRLSITAVGGETEFTIPALVNKDILFVTKDTDAFDVVHVTPGNQQVKVDNPNTTGKLYFDSPSNPGEIIIVLYQ
jgi:hypothetical protein